MGSSDRRLTLTLAGVLVALLVIGAGAAFAVGRAQRLGAAGGSPPSSNAGGTASPSDTAPGGSGTDGNSPGSTTTRLVPSPGRSATPSGDPVRVTLSPRAAASPNAREVADLLERYFTAINRNDYDAWLSTVSTAQAKRDRDDWTKDYSTTHDSDVYISDIIPGKPLTVRMQFVSTQAIEYAPTALPRECVRWDVTYQVVDEGPGLRVGNSAKPPAMAPCG